MPTTIPVNLNFGSFFPLNFKAASEGPRSVPIVLDFTKTIQYNITLQNAQAQTYLSKVLSVFIDNSANGSSTALTFEPSGQIIKISPGMQGYFNVVAPNPVSISFVSWGNVQNVTVFLLNFSTSSLAWSSQVLNSHQNLSSEAGGSVLALTAGSAGYFVEGIYLQFSPDASFATGGIATLSVSSGGSGYPDTGSAALVATSGSGTKANGTFTAVAGVVQTVTVVYAGTGYAVGDTGKIEPLLGPSNAAYTVSSVTKWQQIFLQDSAPGPVITQIWEGIFDPNNPAAFILRDSFLWTSKVAGSSLNLIVPAMATGYFTYTIPYGLCSFLGQ